MWTTPATVFADLQIPTGDDGDEHWWDGFLQRQETTGTESQGMWQCSEVANCYGFAVFNSGQLSIKYESPLGKRKKPGKEEFDRFFFCFNVPIIWNKFIWIKYVTQHGCSLLKTDFQPTQTALDVELCLQFCRPNVGVTVHIIALIEL